jgi:hypothetical protein
MGSLDSGGWAVGRSESSGRTVRVCTPPQSGVFGSSDPLIGGTSTDEEEPSLLGLAEAEAEDDLEAEE